MNTKDFNSDNELSEQTTQNEEYLSLIPPDERGEPPYEDPPYNSPLSLNQISPIAGAVAGGLSITLYGSGFQSGAAAYFGNTPAAQVTFESDNVIHAVTPAVMAPGSVTVSVINPDGSSAVIEGGFTYLSTEAGQQAEVVGISPLAVLENTQTELTIRGRNLIQAYNSGVFALRGSSRCQVSFSNVTTSHDAATGLDTIKVLANIQCLPALQPLERLAIQVLASTRPEAANDGVVQTSKQMFTVLPKSVPVPLAYTPSLTPNQPNLVMVSGRNLDGYQLSLDNGAEVNLQKSSDNFVSGIVQLPENYETSQPVQLLMMDEGGVQVNAFEMEVAPLLQASQPEEYLSLAPPDEMALNLQAVPGQQFIGPTQNDSAVFSLNSLGWGGTFNWTIFEITILDLTIVLPIVNEVHLIPFFDGGGDELDSPVLAEVGKIFRLRGAGLLVAYRIEVQIHIQVAIIIGFYTYTWFGGFWNEFPELDWGIGSVVLGFRIEIEVLVFLSFLVALVKPNGQLEVLASVNLTAGVDFTIDGSGLHFDPEITHSVNVIGINPVPSNPTPCGNKFELLPQNGQAAVPGALGFEAQYAVHEAGDCCLPWDFNIQLLRFRSTGQPEVVQEGFQTTYCLTAVQPPAIVIEPKLAYLDSSGNLVPAADSSGNEVIERLEPHETKREYVLAAKITSIPSGTGNPVNITFPAVTVAMAPASPLALSNGRPDFPGNRNSTNISDFFTGNLLNKTSLTLTIPQNADLTKLIAFTDGINQATIAPNQFEEGTKLVIPGNKVTGRDVAVKVTLIPNNAVQNQQPSANNGDNVDVPSNLREVNFPVKNEETYEEYYRVFKEIRNILHENQTANPTQTSLSNFAKDFQAELLAHGFNNLKTWGQNLWKLGWQFVQGIGATAGVTDDRLLYYARLEALAVLRNYCQRRNPPIILSDQNLNLFELSARGLETDGTNAYIKFESGEANRVVVTGFDPFQLYGFGQLLISNSSGLIALDRHQKSISAGKTFTIRTAVLPVRFGDFDAGLIEKIMNKAAEDSELIMTCSWTFESEFRIDRFAARYRIDTVPDNEGMLSITSKNPFGTTAPFFIESSLPYASPGVLAQNKKVGSPNPIYLFLDQSFSQATKSHGEPTAGSPDSYQPITGSELPNSEEMTSGSGGSYLSNEIFYRTSNVRRSNRSTLPSGHLHAPTVGTTPKTGGPSLTKGAEEILTSLLPYAASVSGTLKIVFPETIVNSTGAIRTITVEVPANYPNEVKISSVEFSQSPTGFQIAPFSTVTIQPGSSAAIEVKFVPTEVKEYTDAVKLRAPDGSVLQIVELQGRGITSAPQIAGFSPTSGTEGTMITVTGEKFTGTTSVKIGGISAPFTVNSDTQITVTVPSGANSSAIEVVTLGGSATSSTQFTVLQPPVIYTFQPSYGGMYSTVTVYGDNLNDAFAFRMGGSWMNITSSSPTHVSATVTATPGDHIIEVDTPNGTASTANIGYFHVNGEYGGGS